MALTHERLIEVLDYNPDTGVFTWRVNRKGPGAKEGKEAGDIHKFGYRRIKVDGVRYRAHRLAWFYLYKQWPTYSIDHINGDRADNRKANLRDVPHSINMMNRNYATKSNKSGLLGVSFQEKRTSPKKYQAKIKDNGKTVLLGYFLTAEEAHAAYMEAKRMRDGKANKDHLRMQVEREKGKVA